MPSQSNPKARRSQSPMSSDSPCVGRVTIGYYQVSAPVSGALPPDYVNNNKQKITKAKKKKNAVLFLQILRAVGHSRFGYVELHLLPLAPRADTLARHLDMVRRVLHQMDEAKQCH